MYNSLFNVLDYVNCKSGKKTIMLHKVNKFEHSRTIMSLLTNLPYYEIRSPQNLKSMAIRLDKIESLTLNTCEFFMDVSICCIAG